MVTAAGVLVRGQDCREVQIVQKGLQCAGERVDEGQDCRCAGERLRKGKD